MASELHLAGLTLDITKHVCEFTESVNRTNGASLSKKLYV